MYTHARAHTHTHTHTTRNAPGMRGAPQRPPNLAKNWEGGQAEDRTILPDLSVGASIWFFFPKGKFKNLPIMPNSLKVI